MTPQQHDRLLMLLRNDNWPMADQIAVMNMVRQEFPATLRDEFAKAAITGTLPGNKLPPDTYAEWAYRMADAMLIARKS